MNVRLTIILLVVLVLLGGYVILTGNNTDEPVADAPATDENGLTALPDETPVLGVDRNTIHAIEVENAAGEQVRIELQSNGWQMEGPNGGAASGLRVTRAITDISQLGTTRTITPTEQGLAPFGLDDPAYEVRLYNAEGEEAAWLRIGDESIAGTSIYVQRGNEPTVYLVNRFRLGGVRSWFEEPPLLATPTSDEDATPQGIITPEEP
jgi:hypothetical protein